MKKLLLTLLCIFAMFAAKAQCDYTLEMTDAWGDGWDNAGNTAAVNTMDVLVNGVVVLDDVAELGGGGGGTPTTTTLPFTVNPGDDITVVWSGGGVGGAGAWEQECSYRILDSNDVPVASVNPILDGGGDILTGTITASCSTCIAPTSIGVTGIAAGLATINFADTNAPAVNDYDYELVNVSLGETPDGTPDGNVTTTQIDLTGLADDANYEIYLRTNCSPDASDFVSFSWNQTISVPGCAENLVPADLTTDVDGLVTFTWDAPTTGGAATSYDFYIGTANPPPFVVNVATTTAAFNVALETTFFWQVVPRNDVGEALSCDVLQFTTKNFPAGPQGVTCGAGDQGFSKFTEAFASQGDWTGDIGGGNGTWIFGQAGATGSPNTGPSGPQDPGGSYMFYEASGDVTVTASAVSPLIDLSDSTVGSEAELSFYIHAFGSGMGSLTVGAATTAAGPFTPIFTWDGQIQINSAAPWLQVGADISSFIGGDLYLEFSHTGAGLFTGDMSIDTLEVIACEPIPACQIPDALDVTVTALDTATVTFNDPNDPDVNNYQYELLDITAGDVADGSVDGSSATPSINLTGLVDGNNYQILIRSICPEGLGTVTSAWSQPLSWLQTPAPDCATDLVPAQDDVVAPGSVAFSWTAPTTGGAVTGYRVLIGDSAATLVELGITPNTAVNIFNIAPSSTNFYQIIPTGPGGDAVGCPIISFTTTALDPAGIDCLSAVAVTDGTYSAQIADTDGQNVGNDNLWYVYTPVTGGALTIDSCVATNSDTIFEVYDACGGNVVASNDDFCGFQSSATFDVVANQQYYIRWFDAYDELQFNWNINLAPACPGVTKTWTGAEWQVGGVTDTAPGIDDYAIIVGDYNSSQGNLDVCSLQVDAIFAVAAGDFVRVAGDINVTSGGAVLVSHTGSLVQVDDLAVANNAGFIDVVVTTPVLDVRDFMIMGSPVDGETREGVWSAAWNVQNYTPSNFNSVPTVTDAYNFADAELDDWNLYTTGALNPGEGFLVRPQASIDGAGGNFLYNYTAGSFNNGVITRPLNFNVGGQLESPNMLSNPYPSAIDADVLLGDGTTNPAVNPEIDAVYFWNHISAPDPSFPGSDATGPNYSMGDISFYNLTGGIAAANDLTMTAPTNVISTAQGFGTFANAAGTVTFNNSMRLTTGNNTLRNSDVTRDRLWLNIMSTEYNVGGSTLVGFTDAATEGFDNKYDSQRMATHVSIFSHIGTNETGYAVQSREAFASDMKVSLGFSSIIEAVTSYTISLSDFDGIAWETNTPYLIDNVTGIITNLIEGSYSFTSDKGVFNNRFTLVFGNEVLGTNDFDVAAISLYPNPAANVVTIASPNAAISMIEITDIRGRVVLTQAVDVQRTATVDVASLDTAIYLVTVTTNGGTFTSRMIKE